MAQCILESGREGGKVLVVLKERDYHQVLRKVVEHLVQSKEQ